MRTPLLALALALSIFAGCIELPDDVEDKVDQELEERQGGTMTAEESQTDDAGLCAAGMSVQISGDGTFCATRTITVEGTIGGFDTLDTLLETFNGDIQLKTGAEGKWGFVATLRGQGSSAAAATAEVDSIQFSWAHENDGGHFLQVVADHEGRANNLEAAIVVTTPPSLALALVAATSNGDVTLEGVPTDNVALATSNGRIVARGDVTQVSLTTSNGDIEADLRPTSDARWMLSTSNGDVQLKVPEGGDYGYQMEGTTSNGEVDYTLTDGEEGECPPGSEYYTPPCNHRTFETRGFRSRDLQASVTLTTSNGEIDVAPR